MTKTFIKKFTSILLGGALLFSTSYSAFATTVSDGEVLKINELMEEYKIQISNQMGEFSFNKTPFFKDFNGYKLVSGCYNFVLPMPTSVRIGDYILEKNNIYSPSEYGYFAVNAETGDILTLEDAIEKGIVELDKLFELENEVNLGFDMYRLGDSNYDGEINVIDATTIQKVGIGLAQQDNKELTTDTVYDFNYDGRVSIVDTTEVQKHIAKIK